MNFDSTLDFAILLSIIAVISPLFVSIINNAHDTKIKKMELFEANRNKILSEFIDATLNYKKDKLNFYKALNRVYLFCDIWLTVKPLPLRLIKEAVENNESIEEINDLLKQFVYIANKNKGKM